MLCLQPLSSRYSTPQAALSSAGHPDHTTAGTRRHVSVTVSLSGASGGGAAGSMAAATAAEHAVLLSAGVGAPGLPGPEARWEAGAAAAGSWAT